MWPCEADLHQRHQNSFADPAGCSSYGALHATCKDYLGSKEKNGNSLACLRNAGSHSAVTYCSLQRILISSSYNNIIIKLRRIISEKEYLTVAVQPTRSIGRSVLTESCGVALTGSCCGLSCRFHEPNW